MHNRLQVLLLIITLSFGFTMGCNSTAHLGLTMEGTGAAPTRTGGGANVFDPTQDPPPGLYTETFHQTPPVNKVDVVWMIDDSMTMQNYQDAISQHGDAFLSPLTDANVDFRIIGITSNATHNDRLKNQCHNHFGATYVTSANPQDFPTCIEVGAGKSPDSGYEEGLEAVRRALDPHYPQGPWNNDTLPSPLNAGFLRADADLQIIYVSDEEDQMSLSDGLSGWGVQNNVDPIDITILDQEMSGQLLDGGRAFDTRYAFIPFATSHAQAPHSANPNNHVAFLQGLKTSVGTKVVAHAITMTYVSDDPADVCHYASVQNGIEVGARYEAVANSLQGTVTDICTSNWGNTLENIALQVTGLYSSWQLTYAPTNVPSIEVKLNGETLPSTAFEYQPVGNNIRLFEVPPYPSTIVVTYE